MTTRRNQLIVLTPAAGLAAGLALLIAAMLAVSAVVGSATAEQGCTTSEAAPLPVTGVPPRLAPLFAAAARRYSLGSQGAAILAGLTSVESGFGQNMGPSSAGAIGWTQFMPATWARWGLDANHDGKADPYTAADAIFSSARYLQASGAPGDWYHALFAYNHSDSYITAVLDRAKELTTSAPIAETAAADKGATLIIGDSLEIGTAPILTSLLAGPVRVDAQIGRPSRLGIAALRRLLPTRAFTTIVFDLGTNDPNASALRASLRQLARLAGQRRVILATVNSPFDQAAKNRVLRTYASSQSNVTLIPWEHVSRRLHLTDGIHGAYPARAHLFANALHTRAGPPATSCEAVIAPGAALGPITRRTGPARLAAIPGQPGMRVDARILPDVIYLIRTYRLSVSAAYATSGHEPGGEHPLGLAVDLVPGPGGSWDDVDRLARWAEPVQNAPRPPFRWAGYDGDPGHGRGNHLHLSWIHAPDPARRPPVAWVDTFAVSGAAV